MRSEKNDHETEFHADASRRLGRTVDVVAESPFQHRKREHFVTPVTCPECALNGSATWEESERGDLETTIKSVTEGFRVGGGTDIYCAECGVKATIGKTFSRSEMKK
jgi:hypothetical protein